MSLDLGEVRTTCRWDQLAVFINDDEIKNRVKKAYDFALEHHAGQKRESGDAYITHPLWIAKVVSQLGLGHEAVIAALLHDLLEDTNVSIDEIADNFGDEVALLVQGLTDVSKKTKGIIFHQTNIEVFRNFLFSSVNDVRILIIRLVDKLHNGLTIEALSQERQEKFAQRIFGVYGPISEYVGLHFFKQQLEDIAFKILYPDEAKKLEKYLEKRSKNEYKAQVSVIEDINKVLQLNKISGFEIQSRIKSLYSTYLKKVKKDYRGNRQFKDRVGVRILLKTIEDCYVVLGLIHAQFKYIPEEFHDYISNPKPNGYRSLQTTVMWHATLMVEIQIRTFEMHEFNEFGPASHIAYKMSKNLTQSRGMEWVADLVKWQSTKTVNNYRISVLTEHVYIFTPTGEVIQLPKGSKPLDFAYRLHSHLGDYCKGVLVNNKMTKLDSELKTGDVVMILTTNKLMAKPGWLNFVITPGAKEHLRKLRNELRDQL